MYFHRWLLVQLMKEIFPSRGSLVIIHIESIASEIQAVKKIADLVKVNFQVSQPDIKYIICNEIQF